MKAKKENNKNTKYYCQRCGTELKINQKICPFCGYNKIIVKKTLKTKTENRLALRLVITFYKKNIWLLVVGLLVIVFVSVIGFFVKPFWSLIINLAVGVCALFLIPYWKIKIIAEKTSGGKNY